MYERYVELRNQKGVSDYRVAKDTGIPKSTFSDWKSGRSKPKIAKLKILAGYFDVAVDELISATDETGFNVLHGSVSDDTKVRWFTQKGKLIWEEEEKIHGFDGVPATEYVENKERTCIFEPAMSMIDAYNKAISEKANDVDYFADAYMVWRVRSDV